MLGIKEITSLQLKETLDNKPSGYRLIDIRSKAEMAQGVIPGAELVPMHLVPLKAEEWRDDDTVVLYCRSGARSAQVCSFLQQQGFNNVVNMRGGIIDWVRQGMSIDFPQRMTGS
ncbi:MAG: rhodanese-like domain-containing protein [Gammaproteobacteria bacterium]